METIRFENPAWIKASFVMKFSFIYWNVIFCLWETMIILNKVFNENFCVVSQSFDYGKHVCSRDKSENKNKE